MGLGHLICGMFVGSVAALFMLSLGAAPVLCLLSVSVVGSMATIGSMMMSVNCRSAATHSA